jgi:hypothetical protein
LALCLSKHVHDLQPVSVGERLKEPLELDRRLFVELPPHERCAARKQVGKLSHFARIISRKADAL